MKTFSFEIEPFGRAFIETRGKTMEERVGAGMKEAAKYFVGKKDFSAFMSANSDVEDTVRTVLDFSLQRNGDEIVIRVSADGFLYNMVRIMVGTLVQVAFNNIKPDEIPAIIEKGKRENAGMTAPPEGLYLNKVFY